MWIFGQVWFACLVGFVVGVLLDWVVRVRPLGSRVAELEARLAAEARSARQDGDYGRSVFDRGPFASANLTPDGFVADRNRGGLLTPSGSLATDLLADDDADERAESRTGVEDFPGVSRISEAWEEAEEATRAAPAPWQPGQLNPQPAAGPATEHFDSWQPEEHWQPERRDDLVDDEPAEERTQVTSWLGGEPDRTAATQSTEDDTDARYLDFLRSGTDQFPSTADTEDDRDLVTQGEMTDPGAADVTSVLPQIEGYQAYESYADEYEQNTEAAGDDSAGDGFHYGGYRFEDVDEPAESSTPLPRREVSGEASLRFAPFQSPFQESELVDAQQPRRGELTPIEEGGFQPFQKPAAVDAGYDSRWLGDDPSGGQPYEYAGAPSTNGSHVLTDDTTATSLFDAGDWQPEGSVTQRILPVSRPDLDHPDLLPESVFGTEGDTVYEEAGPSRSLFEPVIPPEAAADGYQSYEDDGFLPDLTDVPPGYGEPPAGYADQEGFDERQPFADDRPGPTETTDEFATGGFLDEPPVARPVRVRTGVDGPVTQSIPMPPAPPADQPPAETTEPGIEPVTDGPGDGPFGPGSALPRPDGSAPAPGFQVKARTSSMVFHTSSSPFFDRLEPQVWFRTPEDAQRAGFTSWERPNNY